MRVRKKNWTHAELESNEAIVKNPEDFKGIWKEYFKNDNPIYVEIGCGKGKFLSENAAKNPDINYIGIERQPTVLACAARKGREAGVKNTAYVNADVEILETLFAPEEIDRLFINFCDPWPKKRWHKRRLTYRDFLDKYSVLLTNNGEIHFKTDNPILFESSLNEFCLRSWRLKNISLDLHKSDFEGNITTEYEERFLALGMPIYRLEAKKTI